VFKKHVPARINPWKSTWYAQEAHTFYKRSSCIITRMIWPSTGIKDLLSIWTQLFLFSSSSAWSSCPTNSLCRIQRRFLIRTRTRRCAVRGDQLLARLAWPGISANAFCGRQHCYFSVAVTAGLIRATLAFVNVFGEAA